MQKKMTLLIAVFGILFFQTAQAQTYKHKLVNSPDNTVEFILSSSNLSIHGYSGNQLIIKKSNHHGHSRKAKGIHAIGENDIGLSVYEENHTLKVVGTKGNNFMIKVPNKVHLILRLNSGNIKLSNFKGEIEITVQSSNIKLKNITGPVVAYSTGSNINVIFSHLSNAAPSSITVINGNIEVTLPASTKADLNLSTISSNIYSDFNIHTHNSNNNITKNGGRNIKGTLNGGGVELNLRAVSGNIYLQKEK